MIKMLRLLQEQKGAFTVLAVAMMTIFLSFTALVVDLGNLYFNKAQLASVTDASVLAGIQDLVADSDQLAESTALAYATQNGKTGDNVSVRIVSGSTIVVTATRNVTLFFAPVFGISASNVTAKSVAQVLPVTQTTGIVPFGMVKQDFIYGETYQLKAGGGDGYDGNYGGLALGGNGANVYGENIVNGYSGTIKVGEWISTEPGNISGKTSTGVNYRISLDPQATFATVEKDSPRIVTVPIIDSLAVNGKSSVLVVGFAAFFLEGVGGQGNDNYVYGKFMQMVTPSDNVYNDEDYGGITSDVSGGFGLYGTKLLPPDAVN